MSAKILMMDVTGLLGRHWDDLFDSSIPVREKSMREMGLKFRLSVNATDSSCPLDAYFQTQPTEADIRNVLCLGGYDPSTKYQVVEL